MRDIRPSLVPNLSPDIKMLKGNLHKDLSLDLRSSHKAPSAPEISDSAGGRPAAMIPRPAAIRAEDERDMNDVQTEATHRAQLYISINLCSSVWHDLPLFEVVSAGQSWVATFFSNDKPE